VNATGEQPHNRRLPKGNVIGVDLLDIDPLPGVTFLKSDFTSTAVQYRILDHLRGRKVQVVMSDAEPKPTGDQQTDEQNMTGLCFAVLELAGKLTDRHGSLVCKARRSQQQRVESVMRRMYYDTRIVTPQASFNQPEEIFLVGLGFKGLPQR